jgi:hypothetical protein
MCKHAPALTMPPLVLQEIQSLRESHQQQLQQQAAALQQQLAVVATESSASLSRHMGLIDKLMDEKGMLASRLDNAQKAAVVRHSLLTRVTRILCNTQSLYLLHTMPCRVGVAVSLQRSCSAGCICTQTLNPKTLHLHPPSQTLR